MHKLGSIRKLKIKQDTYAQLIRKADKVFSNYIRERDGWTCITCGTKGDKSTIQNGHYIERNKKGTRYDEKNCHAQCVNCNVWKKGNLRIYAQRLVQMYGADILDDLQAKADASKGQKYPRADLIEIISLYTLELEKLQRKNNLQIIHVNKISEGSEVVKEGVNAKIQ